MKGNGSIIICCTIRNLPARTERNHKKTPVSTADMKVPMPTPCRQIEGVEVRLHSFITFIQDGREYLTRVSTAEPRYVLNRKVCWAPEAV